MGTHFQLHSTGCALKQGRRRIPSPAGPLRGRKRIALSVRRACFLGYYERVDVCNTCTLEAFYLRG